ncbi:CHRD domain-containing protein [Rhodoferax koreense]|uniref:CHRD domain-containing protein n=1 Tax=Rhodoferax koreensis TaxID=1842727 RepID=A0A1P8JUM0_9BURK|nr:CHRD domain-containing protein [Rhodoferax koreense]APW37444.1 CHRD domain-containing protein [Rhodoferax koreense]
MLGVAAASTLWLAGCGTFGPGASAPAPRDPQLAAFSAQMTSMNEVPPVPGAATGRVDAVLNKETNLLRWRLTYTGLSGQPTMGHFHGPAPVGVNAPVVLPFGSPLTPSMSGQATLTAAQAADLLAGRWYANVHTAAHPAGEIRGQMILRE